MYVYHKGKTLQFLLFHCLSLYWVYMREYIYLIVGKGKGKYLESRGCIITRLYLVIYVFIY